MIKWLCVCFLFFCTASSTFADQLNLDKYKGKVVYIDFWASWCGPCRQSFPWMESLHEAKNKDGLVIIAVNMDQEKNLADNFLSEFKPNFNIVFDPEGTLATEYKVTSMPTSYLIDRSGKLHTKHQGYHSNKTAEYEKEIQQLLDEKM